MFKHLGRQCSHWRASVSNVTAENMTEDTTDDIAESVAESVGASVAKNATPRSKKNPKCVHGITRAMCKKCKCWHKGGTQYWATCSKCGPRACAHGLFVRCKFCWLCEHRKWNSNCTLCRDFASFEAKMNQDQSQFQPAEHKWQAEVDYYVNNPLAWAALQAEVRKLERLRAREKCPDRHKKKA